MRRMRIGMARKPSPMAPLRVTLRVGGRRVAEEGHPERSDCPEAEVVRTLAHGYVQALLTGDEARAEVLVREAIDLDLTEREVAEEIIAPAMQRIGALWERGEISVADEHLATQITLRVLVLQREAFRTS